MPSTSAASAPGNQILAGLPATVRQRLLTHFKLLTLLQGDFLYKVNASVRHVYFPLNAVLALMALTQDGRNVVVTLIGHEGLLGIQTLLGGKEVLV